MFIKKSDFKINWDIFKNIPLKAIYFIKNENILFPHFLYYFYLLMKKANNKNTNY